MKLGLNRISVDDELVVDGCTTITVTGIIRPFLLGKDSQGEPISFIYDNLEKIERVVTSDSEVTPDNIRLGEYLTDHCGRLVRVIGIGNEDYTLYYALQGNLYLSHTTRKFTGDNMSLCKRPSAGTLRELAELQMESCELKKLN